MSRHGGRDAQHPRSLRVAEEIRHAMARILSESGLRDPDLAATNVTVSEVRLSPDMGTASIYVAPLGGGDMARLLAALKRAQGYLRSRLAQEVKLRYVPRLRFIADTSFDEAARIDRLLREGKTPAQDDGDEG